jgi:hypothetical protein
MSEYVNYPFDQRQLHWTMNWIPHQEGIHASKIRQNIIGLTDNRFNVLNITYHTKSRAATIGAFLLADSGYSLITFKPETQSDIGNRHLFNQFYPYAIIARICTSVSDCNRLLSSVDKADMSVFDLIFNTTIDIMQRKYKTAENQMYSRNRIAETLSHYSRTIHEEVQMSLVEIISQYTKDNQTPETNAPKFEFTITPEARKYMTNQEVLSILGNMLQSAESLTELIYSKPQDIANAEIVLSHEPNTGLQDVSPNIHQTLIESFHEVTMYLIGETGQTHLPNPVFGVGSTTASIALGKRLYPFATSFSVNNGATGTLYSVYHSLNRSAGNELHPHAELLIAILSNVRKAFVNVGIPCGLILPKVNAGTGTQTIFTKAGFSTIDGEQGTSTNMLLQAAYDILATSSEIPIEWLHELTHDFSNNELKLLIDLYDTTPRLFSLPVSAHEDIFKNVIGTTRFSRILNQIHTYRTQKQGNKVFPDVTFFCSHNYDLDSDEGRQIVLQMIINSLTIDSRITDGNLFTDAATRYPYDVAAQFKRMLTTMVMIKIFGKTPKELCIFPDGPEFSEMDDDGNYIIRIKFFPERYKQNNTEHTILTDTLMMQMEKRKKFTNTPALEKALIQNIYGLSGGEPLYLEVKGNIYSNQRISGVSISTVAQEHERKNISNNIT